MKTAALWIAGWVFTSLASSQAAVAQTAGAKEESQRGEYLVAYGGCNDCHTPKLVTPSGPVPDRSRLLSGHPANAQLPPVPPDVGSGPNRWGAVTNSDLTAWAGPWGISFAANLTPDPQTGIGAWTREQFIKTMRTGKHLGVDRPLPGPEGGVCLPHVTEAHSESSAAATARRSNVWPRSVA